MCIYIKYPNTEVCQQREDLEHTLNGALEYVELKIRDAQLEASLPATWLPCQ